MSIFSTNIVLMAAVLIVFAHCIQSELETSKNGTNNDLVNTTVGLRNETNTEHAMNDIMEQMAGKSRSMIGKVAFIMVFSDCSLFLFRYPRRYSGCLQYRS